MLQADIWLQTLQFHGEGVQQTTASLLPSLQGAGLASVPELHLNVLDVALPGLHCNCAK